MIRISIVCEEHGDEIFEVEIPAMDNLDQTIQVATCERCKSEAFDRGYTRARSTEGGS